MEPLNIQLTQDRVLVKLIDNAAVLPSGLLVPETALERPQRGEVVATGPGLTDDRNAYFGMDVEVGDTVVFAKYAGAEFVANGEKYWLLKTVDLLGYVDSAGMFKPLSDLVKIFPLERPSETVSGLAVIASDKEVFRKGGVLIAGHGKYNNRTGELVPTDIEDGAVVVYPQFAATEIEDAGGMFVVVHEADIIGSIDLETRLN